MAGNCELCGGKVVNGRCTDCGMDYSRMKNRYHLNENCSDYDLNARDINDGYEKSLKSKGERANAPKEKTVLNGRASVKPNVSRPQREKDVQKAFETVQANVSSLGKSAARRAQTMSQPADRKKQGGLKKALIIIFLVFVLFNSLGEIISSIMDSNSSSYEPVYSEPVYSESEEDLESSQNLPQLPAAGDTVDFDLQPYACYVVGVDIPEGTYTLTNMDKEYSGTVYMENETYDIDEAYYIETGKSEENVQLYDGSVIWLNTPGTINCMSDNAQRASMHEWTGDTGDAEIGFPAEEDNEAVYTVGMDIDPGRYIAKYDGSGTSVISVDIRSDNRTSYISLSDPQYNKEQSTFAGLVLTEGMEIAVERFGDDYAEVSFVPMGTEETVPVQNNELSIEK